jgi:TonB-dependent starch-binding outer membrane protein SusC
MNLLECSKRLLLTALTFMVMRWSRIKKSFGSRNKTLLLAMKLTFILMTAALLQVSAGGLAQTVTFSGRDVSIKKVFSAIEKQTGYVFFYDEGLLQNTKPVTLNVTNASLQDVLTEAFSGQLLIWKIVDKTITVIKKTDVEKPAPVLPQMDIHGKVTDVEGRSLVGVSVVVKGSIKGTSTNTRGEYNLKGIDNDAVVVFSIIGYTQESISVRGRSTIDIVLKVDLKKQDEVVVIGYGTIKRKDLTGSVASVNVDEIKNTPFVSVDQALAGKAAGVQVTQADGSPGGIARIRVRGGTSLMGGNDPLYIIDGVQMTVADPYVTGAADVANPTEFQGGGDLGTYGLNTVASATSRGVNTLAGININDIESIDILKDASATAIYGSKAANGVVIITTKKGKKNQKPILNAGYYTGFSNAITEKLLNAAQYKQVYLEGATNTSKFLQQAGLPANAAASAILADPSLLGTANTDWMKLVTRVGRTQNADVNISGGGAASSFYTSLAYNKQTGTLLGTDFQRISGKVNLENEITSKLKLNTNIDYSFTKNNITNGIYSSALYMPPTIAPYTNGKPTVLQQISFGTIFTVQTGAQNPLALLQGTNQANTASLLGSLTLEYDILKDLTYKSTASVNYSNYRQLNYTPSTVQAYYNSSLGTTGGVGSQAQSVETDMFFENTLTYDKKFDLNNHLTFLAGTSWENTKYNSFSASGEGYPNDTYLTGLSSAATYLKPTSSEYVSSLLSFYLRANYSFKDRYLLTLTGRADESSKFPSANRTGYFPSFGVAWKVNNESFLTNVTWIDELKLRASAGYTGTQNIGNNLFYTLFTPGSYASTNALIPSQLGNDKLKWENTLQKDAGIDFSFFNSRLSGSVGYYSKHTSGILLAAPQPSSTGFASALENVADIDNKGLEVVLNGDIIRKKKFSWNINLNISGNRSIVTGISGALQNPSGVPNTDPDLQSLIIGNTALVPGRPVGEIYGYIYQGVIKTQKQLDEYKSQSFYAQLGFLPDLGIGSPMYALFTSGNYKGFFKRDVIGNAQPKFYGGLTNTVNYKQFSLTVLFTYSYGGQLLYLLSQNSFGLGTLGNKNTQILLPTYSSSNPGANRPALYLDATNTDGAYGATSANVFNDSYIKLKSLSVSYNLPDHLLKKLGVKTTMIYVAGSNLFAITKYPGPDPEVSNDPRSLINGYTDDATYPTMRQYTIGARLRF